MIVIVVLIAVALILGGLLGTLIVRDPGYVLIAYDDLTLETSIWFGIFVLMLVLLVVFGVVYVVVKLTRGRSGLSTWVQQRRYSGARKQTLNGLLQMAEGQWSAAKKSLLSAVDRAETPLINYLSAARAAHELDDVDERDRLLHLAHETTPGARLAVALTQAQLQLDKGQWEQSLATLIQLRKEHPKHPLVLAMLRDCFSNLGDWDALQELIPQLLKQKIGDPDEIARLHVQSWRARLEKIRSSGEAAQHAKHAWKEVPREFRKEASLISVYADLLTIGGEPTDAESLLRGALGRDWRDEWIDAYGKLDGHPATQLKSAEGWLRERPSNPRLLLALGRLSLRNEQWGKAREYLEASLRLAKSPEVYGELGRLCCALGDTGRGREYLQQAIGLPEFPLPEVASSNDEVAVAGNG